MKAIKRADELFSNRVKEEQQIMVNLYLTLERERIKRKRRE